MKVFDSITGRWLEPKQYQFIDKCIELAKDKNPWAVIDEIVAYWNSTPHTQWKAHLIELKNSRFNKFGSNKDKSLRYIVDVPQQILYMIRAIYKVDQLDMNKDWFRRFGRRYPQFLVAEKI